jgi:predicted permease
MGLWSRLRRTVRAGRLDDDIDEELQFHLEMDQAGGRDPRAARLRLGNVARIREETRAMRTMEWLGSVLTDARYGLRHLRATPALVAAVVLSLTIGIGASAAIVSLVDAAIFRPLPVADPNRLIILEWTHAAFPAGITNHNGEYRRMAEGKFQGSSVAAHIYRRLAREQTSYGALSGIGAYPDPIAVALDASPAEQLAIQYVSTNFFQVLGVMPSPGRQFHPDEDAIGREPVVIVSHRYWQSRLAGSPAVLERPIRINGVAARVVGVAPAGFFGTRAGQWPDFYAPLAAKVAFQPAPANGAPRAEDDGNWWVRLVARAQPGVADVVARERFEALFKRVSAPEGTTDTSQLCEIVTRPGARGFESLNPRDIRALRMLMLLVGVLLLLVCANVANLLLSRAVARQHESAMRLALGATRLRVFRQHLIEGAMLAMLGGAAGLAVGYVFAQSIHMLFQSGRDASNAFDLHTDVRVVASTAALSMLSALLFSLAPAWRAARARFGQAIQGQARSIVGGRMRLPRALVSLQIALCLAAIVAAGLLVRSLEKLKWMDVGFDRNQIVYASVSPARAGYSTDRFADFAERVRAALARLPGVVSVSPVQTRLLSGGGNATAVQRQGRPPLATGPVADPREVTHLNAVGEGFFETLGIPLLVGRTLTAADFAPGTDAVVVDELFVRRFFPGEDPLGKRFGLGRNPAESSQYSIVGVVGNSRYNSMRNDLMPTLYAPFRAGGTIHLAIRSTMAAVPLGDAVRKAVASIDPSVPVTELHTQSALIDRTLRTERLLGIISAALGVIALTIAAIGLAGLLAYVVAKRRTEIGLRIALGASSRNVVRMVLADCGWLVGAGLLVGLPCAYGVARLLRTSLFQLEPFDVPTTVAACAVLGAVSVAAPWLPARRAASIDAITALRQE